MKIHGISLPLPGRPAGQTLTEFAMTVTLFSMFLFGIMQLGLAVNAYNSMSTAAHEAARYAMVHSPTSANSPCPSTGSCPSVAQQAVNYAPFLAKTDVTATFSCQSTTPPSCNAASSNSDYAVVSITHAYPLNIPFMSSVNLNLKANSQMLVSQ
jgi:Flp pilus assembly protein TadG